MHPIIESLGLKELPTTEVELLQKILQDNLVTLRAQQLMVSHFAVAAIEQMHPVERAALIKRISPPPTPVHHISWTVQKATHSGQLHIHGQCGRCGQDVNFTGKPDDAPHVVWSHCTLGPSKIPASVVEEYRAKHVYEPPTGSGRF